MRRCYGICFRWPQGNIRWVYTPLINLEIAYDNLEFQVVVRFQVVVQHTQGHNHNAKNGRSGSGHLHAGDQSSHPMDREPRDRVLRPHENALNNKMTNHMNKGHQRIFVTHAPPHATSHYDRKHASQRYCGWCGQYNHETRSCKHRGPIQCYTCNKIGHKEKYCSMYHWYVGQEGHSNVHDSAGDSFNDTIPQEISDNDNHRRNTPSARVPLLTAPSAGSIYLFAQFPTPTRVLLSRGLSGGSSKPPTHCSRQAFEATFDKLQLIRTTLISKMIKTL